MTRHRKTKPTPTTTTLPWQGEVTAEQIEQQQIEERLQVYPPDLREFVRNQIRQRLQQSNNIGKKENRNKSFILYVWKHRPCEALNAMLVWHPLASASCC
jgi:hypothetical protein